MPHPPGMDMALPVETPTHNSTDAFVARQPILDLRQHVAGYELLYRNSPINRFPGIDGTRAAASLMEEALSVFGLDRLVPPGTRAFVNLTREVLVRGLYRMLPPQRVVLELLESIPPDGEVLRACDEALEHGYQLALDDHAFEEDRAELVRRSAIIKLEWPLVKGRRDLVAQTQALAQRGQDVLAEKVETQEELKAATDAGCRLFQGFYLFRPEMVRVKTLPVSKAHCVQVMRVVNQSGFDLDAVEDVLRKEVSLSVRLLRYLNSAAFALRSPVQSLHQALIYLGELPLRTWLNVALMAHLGEGRPAEVITRALIRARCCELVGKGMGTPADLDMFLMGLLSLLDVMLSRPLPELLELTGVGPDLRSALLSGQGRAGELLAAVLAVERGSFDDATLHSETLCIRPSALAEAYQEAVTWADSVMANW